MLRASARSALGGAGKILRKTVLGPPVARMAPLMTTVRAGTRLRVRVAGGAGETSSRSALDPLQKVER